MNDTRKRLIAALQEMLDECANKMPYAEGWEYDFLRGRYSAIIDIADRITEIIAIQNIKENDKRDKDTNSRNDIHPDYAGDDNMPFTPF